MLGGARPGFGVKGQYITSAEKKKAAGASLLSFFNRKAVYLLLFLDGDAIIKNVKKL